ncbi:unnamed protein product [Caretta caretta]
MGEPLLLVPEQHILLLHRSPLVPPVPSYNPAVEAWYLHQCPGPLLFGHTGHPGIPTKAAGTIGGLLSAIPLSVYEDEEEDVEPLPPVLPVLTAAASSPDEMLISSSLSPPDDHCRYQDLLQRVTTDLWILLEEVQGMQHQPWTSSNLRDPLQ